METISELGRNYIVIRDEADEKNDFRRKMLINNNINGLLSVTEYYKENEPFLKYEITNMRSLKKEYEGGTLTYDKMSRVLIYIMDTVGRMEHFLIDGRFLVYDPEYIFTEIDSEEMKLLCLPYEGEFASMGYRHLAEFFLEKADYQDNRAVNLAYSFYKMSKEELFSIRSFREKIYVGAEDEKVVDITKEKEERIFQYEEPEAGLPAIEPEEYDKESSDVKVRLLAVGVVLMGVMLTVVVLFFKNIMYYRVIVMMLGSIGGVLAVMLTAQWRKSRLEAEDRDIENNILISSGRVDDYWEDDEKTRFFDVRCENEFSVCWRAGGKDRRIIVNRFPFVIGAKRDSVDGCIEDESVSRRHARFLYKDNCLKICDLGSTNGTLVRGERIMPGEEIVVERNDEIQFGKVTATVV
ncbi:MAG: FHA domain-containing protein [Lachnospiraceae bacterium]|nr:FHA domain-containing protein [Lachnospiraceae bacterium]